MNAIETQSLSKAYRVGNKHQRVLNNVSFSIPRGETSVIFGRSGSGKSTLLNLLAGLDSPDDGTISVFETLITKKDQEFLAKFRLENIGLVFQFFNLLPTLSLRDNVALPAYLAGERKNSAIERAVELLRKVGLESQISRLPREVSGGEIQRAAIARALINNPMLVLADEPTGNLDQANALQVLELLVNLTKEKQMTLVVVSHDELVEKMASHLFHLSDGVLIA